MDKRVVLPMRIREILESTMHKFVLMFLIFCLFVLAGCPSKPIKQPIASGTATTLDAAANQQSESLNRIKTANDSNAQATVSIRTHVDESNRDASNIAAKTQDTGVLQNVESIVSHNEKIRERAEVISNNTATIAAGVDSATAQNQQIKNHVAMVEHLQNKIVKLENEKQQMQNDAIKDLYTTLSFFFGLGFVTIVAGLVVAFLVNRRLGMSIAALGLMALALAAGAIYYLKTIAVVAIVIIIAAIVLCVGIGVWYLVRENREKRDLEQANVENVQLVQTIKERLDPNAKVEIFGESKTGIAHKLQSEKTQRIVKRVKDNIKTIGTGK